LLAPRQGGWQGRATVTTASAPFQPTVCIAENRRSCEPALRILVASMARHCPGLPVALFVPDASEAFADFVTNYPSCSLNPRPLSGLWTKYDIKPVALLTVLEAGARSVIWIDSDILIARDFRPIFAGLDDGMIAVTEEALCSSHGDPDGLRARLWGMPVGRVLPFTLNTGVVRVTQSHLPLLRAWNALLQSEAYRSGQALPWDQRGLHVLGDQEVLTALLASEPYAGVPLRFLRRGRDIIQFFGSTGYTTAERVGNLRHGLPPFIHSQGFRPWWPREPTGSGWSDRFATVYRDLSPYTVAAQSYADVLDDPTWLTPPSRTARLLRGLGAANVALTGLPLALVADAARVLKRRSDTA
jgi:hypothetical protein